jgi:hypothetical protein
MSSRGSAWSRVAKVLQDKPNQLAIGVLLAVVFNGYYTGWIVV